MTLSSALLVSRLERFHCKLSRCSTVHIANYIYTMGYQPEVGIQQQQSHMQEGALLHLTNNDTFSTQSLHALKMCVVCYRFTGSVKLKGVVVIGGEDEHHPRELQL